MAVEFPVVHGGPLGNRNRPGLSGLYLTSSGFGIRRPKSSIRLSFVHEQFLRLYLGREALTTCITHLAYDMQLSEVDHIPCSEFASFLDHHLVARFSFTPPSITPTAHICRTFHIYASPAISDPAYFALHFHLHLHNLSSLSRS